MKPTSLIRHPDRFFIGGEWVAPSSASTFDVIAPATEELFMTVAEAQEPDVRRAVAAARDAFDCGPWRRMTIGERVGHVRRMATLLRERGPDIAQAWPNEMGITYAVAGLMGGMIANDIEAYCDMAEGFAYEEEHEPLGGGEIGLIVREPVGVVAAIIPWNGPIIMIAHKTIPALLAGCTVIVKSSPEAPSAAYIMAEIAEAAGLPPGVFNILTADRAVSELLVRDPGVDKISFTGSTAAGKRVASLCGERVARYTLELGGKSAAIILDDVDIATAAEAIAGPACVMSGQVCSSLTRIIVPRRRHDALVEALVASFSAKKVGDPFDPEIDLGPVAMQRQRDRIEDIMARGAAESGMAVTGGGRPAHLNRGFYIEPTVFANVSNDALLAREEIFGPVLSVIPAADEEEAISLANDTVYGLNNSVFTNDADRAYAIARELRSGTVGQNMWRTDFSMAFGGFKQSGIGREGLQAGLTPFVETKTIILDERPSHLAKELPC